MPEARKLVTILFADTTGSTVLGETLDSEDVRALMARYYDHARRVIAEHGGTLEKFIGDAVMAVFGLPQAHGNDAERALAAALALRDIVAQDTILSAAGVVLHLGVNTGEVMATADPASGDFLVTGDAVNVAARLYDAAEPGEILAGERTHAAAEAAMLFAQPRQITVKNKRQPVAAYPLLGSRPVRQRSRPPLVGRRRELAQLTLLRDAALEERHPQLVSIVAPAGTGKTRLLEEFLAGLDPGEGWRVATARCLPYGQSLTYWPLRGLLDELLGAPFTLELVRAAYLAGGQTDEDAARLAGLVLASLGAELESEPGQVVARQMERESTFAAWRLLVEALARTAPRIVVFEDLHWASESLLDLVEHVTHPRTQAALLIVVLSRPELLDRCPDWGGGMRNFTVLALDALGAAQTRQLVDELVPETVAEAVRARIVERSGGNPFFAIELSRGLAERLGDGMTGAGVDVLPETVHEAVLARLDLLSGTEREVVQVAAVAGRTFRPPTLHAALPMRAPEAIAGALEGLLARDVVVPAEGEAGAYTFRHILFRDVAYNTLSRAERVRLHLAVATWLEAFAAERLDEFVELLAYHYREAATLAARSAVPLGITVDAERAVRYLVRAGELASHAGLTGPAIAHLRAAIALAPEDEHERLSERLGDVAVEGDTAIEGYRHALDLWRARREADLLTGARLLRKLLYVYWAWWTSYSVPRNMEDLEELHAEALRLAVAAGDEDELWRVRLAPLNGFARPGTRKQRERERDICKAAAAHFEERQDWPALYIALDSYAAYSQMFGEHEEAIAASRRCLDWPDLPVWARLQVQSMLVNAHFHRCDFDASLAAAREAVAQLRPGDPIGMLGEGICIAASAACLGGRWTEQDHLRHVLGQVWDEARLIPGMLRVNLWLSNMAVLAVALAREDRPAADAAAGALRAVLDPANLDTPWRESVVAAYLADDPASFDLDAMIRNSSTPPWTLEFLVERGLSAPDWLIQKYRESGYDHAHEYAAVAEALNAGDNTQLAAAIAAAEARQLVPLAARARITLAQRTGDPSHLERARPVLERLGDRQFLRRLEEVAASLPAAGIPDTPDTPARKPTTRPRKRAKATSALPPGPFTSLQ